MPLFSLIQSILHFPGLASDFFYRSVASKHRQKTLLRCTQIAVNDFTKFASLVEGAASIAEIICRCSIFEHVCLQSNSAAADELKRALVQLYAAIMIYLSKAKSYVDENSASEYGSFNFRLSAYRDG